MADYKTESHFRASESDDSVELQEREDDYEGDRLLPDRSPRLGDDIVYKEEWHIRTGWAVAGSIFGVIIAVLGLVLFVKHVIISDANIGTEDVKGLGDFRRPESEYILDPTWNFNAPRTVREYKWTIVDIVGNPDGVFRPMLTINGQFPGPMIECNEGDTLVIEVENLSANSTALHFHGIFQNGTNFMDGTTGVTQCPIAPSRKFRYEFTVTGQSGTYYYHGHQGVQSSDGLYGPLIIHSKNEKKLQTMPYATDRVVMLQDYYHDPSSGLLVKNLQPGSFGSPIPDGGLINGLNQRDCSMFKDRMCDNSTAPIPSFDLAANANHRLRFINTGAFAWFEVAIDDHQFAVTEVDGTDVLPAYESSLMISPAQRYSMVLTTNQSTSDSFWLRARMVSKCWNGVSAPSDEVKAVIHYSSSDKNKPRKTSIPHPTSKAANIEPATICKDMDTISYIPAEYQPPPTSADYTYYLNTHMSVDTWKLERGFFNESSFRGDLQHPTLHRTIEGLNNQNETFTTMSSANGVNSLSYDLKNDFLIQHNGVKVVDIILQSFDQGNHPMHLHGHKVWVLGSGSGAFPGYESMGFTPQGKGVLPGYEGTTDNIMRRDVATLEGKGWLALRFIADNPGIWAFHCHMAWHSEAGLSMQFLDRIDEVAKWEIPEASRGLCEGRLEELEKGASPKDSIWTGTGSSG